VTTEDFAVARVAEVGKSEISKKNWGNGEVLTEIIGKSTKMCEIAVLIGLVAGVEVPHYG